MKNKFLLLKICLTIFGFVGFFITTYLNSIDREESKYMEDIFIKSFLSSPVNPKYLININKYGRVDSYVILEFSLELDQTNIFYKKLKVMGFIPLNKMQDKFCKNKQSAKVFRGKNTVSIIYLYPDKVCDLKS